MIEDNSYGTHEYFELCEQLGCKTYVNGNMASGTVQEQALDGVTLRENGVSLTIPARSVVSLEIRC